MTGASRKIRGRRRRAQEKRERERGIFEYLRSLVGLKLLGYTTIAAGENMERPRKNDMLSSVHTVHQKGRQHKPIKKERLREKEKGRQEKKRAEKRKRRKRRRRRSLRKQKVPSEIDEKHNREKRAGGKFEHLVMFACFGEKGQSSKKKKKQTVEEGKRTTVRGNKEACRNQKEKHMDV